MIYGLEAKFNKINGRNDFDALEIGTRPGVEIYFLKRTDISSLEVISSFLYRLLICVFMVLTLTKSSVAISFQYQGNDFLLLWGKLFK